MDKISNLIINIKNAGNVEKEHASVPFSNFRMEIALLLKKEGYLKDVVKKGKKPKFTIEMEIAFKEDGTPRVEDVKRVSKPSKRIYFGAKDIRPVKGGRGILVLSTPKGILTDRQARKENVGGEVLFKIW
ncbi:30S ribosomal protein S8 [Candidatus Campbellbacteria bacterium RIFCSPLOWO2_01_FULL_34_15]|uniref:Small ribosomal subunit protein uS8 n=2 Tax=Candidatus Campbelliibacteriota TaxID=1752727 RepID=A0A1F5EQ07_9BACT|nr:MAG: 30S ribosomal protein S8 [Candidatus Campbellbacteria bacterium RIFCSPLOWO2_01_FULL_34_15]OGD69608.1 MAG: 30S ribosomal protein S8 [Candidatus Campbellbacteria bacterium RIFCSPHIGHO2_01_FULL_34_10]